MACLLAGCRVTCNPDSCMILGPDEPAPAPAREEGAPVGLPSDCPAAGEVEGAGGISRGSEAQVATDLLAALDSWANAGTAMVVNEPEWMAPGVPVHCLRDLADELGRVHGARILAEGADRSVEMLRRSMVNVDLANLQAAHRRGRATEPGSTSFASSGRRKRTPACS